MITHNKGITHTKERTVVIIITSNRKGPIVDVSFTHIKKISKERKKPKKQLYIFIRNYKSI